MSEQTIKNNLLSIIEESEQLQVNDLEVVPGTRIRVKKGRVEEFLNNAKLYYQLKNGVILTTPNALNEIKQVYYELSDELAKQFKENLISKVSNIYSVNKEEGKRLEELNKSLESNLKDQEKYRKVENELRKRAPEEPRIWEEIASVQEYIKSLENDEIKLRNTIAEIKDKVNNSTKQIIEEQMQILRNNYIKAKPRNHETGFDGAPILSYDKEEYDNLYILLKVIENVNEKLPIINVNDSLFVNPHQVDTTKVLLPKLNFLRTANIEITSKKPELLELNTELKEQITLELKELIKRAKEHPNEPLAPGKEVLASDLEKYNLLARQFEILTMIYDTDELTTVENAQIPVEKEQEYKMISNKLSSLKEKQKAPKEIDLSVNQALIEQIRKEINDLVTNISLNNDGLERFNLLARQIEILNNVDKKGKLIQVENIIINAEFAHEYKEILTKLEELKNKKEASPLIINESLIKDTEAQINSLREHDQVSPINLEEYELLNKKINILKEVKSTDSLVSIDGATISALKIDEYVDILEKLNNLKKAKDEPTKPEEIQIEPPKEPLKRKAVKLIRKTTKKEWWQQNWKKVAGIGLSLTVVVAASTTLIPTIIYANSCIALASPAIAGPLGAINKVLASIGNVSASNLNFNIAASHAFTASLTSLAKIGLIGGGIVASSKLIKSLSKENTYSNEEKENAKNKIKEFGQEILKEAKSLGKKIKDKSVDYLNSMNKDLVIGADFKEIEENVGKKIEEEDRLAAEERINERYEQIKSEDTPIESKEEIPEIIGIKSSPIKTVIPLPEQMPSKSSSVTIPNDDEIAQILNSIFPEDTSLGRGR